jgi:hypothetical protein
VQQENRLWRRQQQRWLCHRHRQSGTCTVHIRELLDDRIVEEGMRIVRDFWKGRRTGDFVPPLRRHGWGKGDAVWLRDTQMLDGQSNK